MEQRLCSPGSDFSKLSAHFVCVRLYYTAKGASEPFARLGLGDPRGPRNNVDLAFLAPDGRNLDVRTLKPVEGPSMEGRWMRDIVSREKNQAGDGEEIVEVTVSKMRELVKLYPVKKDPHLVPWQVSLSHAIFVSAWDSQVCRNGGARDERRVVLVSSPVDPELEKLLEAPELLKKVERHYVFARIDPKDAPAELKEALDRAGPKGLLILDSARSVDGFGQSQQSVFRTYPKVLASPAGALTKWALAELLGKHVAR